MPVAELAVQLLAGVDLPDYNTSENQMLAIDPGDRFGYLGDHVLTSTGDRYPESEYERLTNEQVFSHSYAKFSTYQGKPFMVGALPRVILSGDKLEGKASELYRQHKLHVDPGNTLSNNFCQAIELVHAVERSIMDVEELLAEGLADESLTEFEVYESRGINVVEAPRGLLYHDYRFDSDGAILGANIITPLTSRKTQR